MKNSAAATTHRPYFLSELGEEVVAGAGAAAGAGALGAAAALLSPLEDVGVSLDEPLELPASPPAFSVAAITGLAFP